jgi:hypothetical protein
MRRLAPLLALALLALAAAPAQAEVRTHKLRYGPIDVAGYQVKQDLSFDVPAPKVDGFITAMDVDVVDARGRKVPIDRLMLHHVVFGQPRADARLTPRRHVRHVHRARLQDAAARPLPALLRRRRGARGARLPAGLRLPDRR